MQEILSEVIERDEVLRHYGQVLQNHGIDEQGRTILVKDNRLDRIAVLVMRDGNKKELYCKLDDTNNCVHIGYPEALQVYHGTEYFCVQSVSE
jgi:hypothetical protein